MQEKKKDNKKYAIVVAVILIPLLYSFFYLYAFWDPYSHLKELPVAVVNKDVGANINGSTRNVGNEILDKLKTDKNLKWVVTDEKDAVYGVKNRRYYAEILIPDNYSQKLSTVDKNSREQGLIYYEPEEKRNYLASQVLSRIMLELKDNISQNVTKEIVSNIVDEMKKVPQDLSTLNEGITKLNEGSKTLSGGMTDLNTGLSELNKKAPDLKGGSNTLAKGTETFAQKLSDGESQVEQLQAGSQKFNTGMQEVGKGADKLNQAIGAIKSGSVDLSKGTVLYSKNMQDFSQAINSYVDAISVSAQGDKVIAQAITSYVKAHPEALQDSNIKSIVEILQKSQESQTKLETASNLIKTNITALVQGTKTLEVGSKNLSDGVDQFAKSAVALPQGVSQLAGAYSQINDGIKKVNTSVTSAAENAKILSKGIKDLNGGIIAFTDGVSQANTGTSKLLDGSQKMESGLKQAKEGVSEAIKIAEGKLSKLNGIDTYASDPIKMVQNNIDPVPDYGTAFAPYFISLSLWVAALLLFIGIYLDPLVKFKILSKGGNKVKRFAAYSVISALQALLLAVVLKHGLKLPTKNTVLFYLTTVVIALSFMMIVQFLMVNLKEVGKFLTLLLLILQLTACGGTFPMELVPGFFKAINAFMPMTYSVNILKEVISGVDYNFLIRNIFILSSIGIVFLLISVVLAKTGRLTEKEETQDFGEVLESI